MGLHICSMHVLQFKSNPTCWDGVLQLQYWSAVWGSAVLTVCTHYPAGPYERLTAFKVSVSLCTRPAHLPVEQALTVHKHTVMTLNTCDDFTCTGLLWLATLLVVLSCNGTRTQ
jgi:hypothetical protein